jgi:hypothetical protein
MEHAIERLECFRDGRAGSYEISVRREVGDQEAPHDDISLDDQNIRRAGTVRASCS